MNEDKSDWNTELLNKICCFSSVEAIQSLERPDISVMDKLVWLWNNSGKFSVKEAYSVTVEMRNAEIANPVWRNIWKIKSHERLKLHCWRIATGVLPTRKGVVQRLGGGETGCILCGEKEESELHVFLHCAFTRALAFGSSWGCRLECLNVLTVEQLITICCKPPKK